MTSNVSTSPQMTGSASNTQSIVPRCNASQAGAVNISRTNGLSCGHRVPSAARIRGSRKGATVGIIASRNEPTSGSRAPCATETMSSAARMTPRARFVTSSPTLVKRTLRFERSTSNAPSKRSSSAIPTDSVDCVTKLAAAARPKC